MFRANTISLWIVCVAGTKMLHLVTVFIVYVVTLISFFIFKLLTLRVFLSMLRDHICLFCFDFLFFFRPLCRIRRPTSSGRCVCCLFAVSCFASYYIGSRNVQQKNIAAHIHSYQTFSELRTLKSFPISVQSISLHIAYLVSQKRAYGTILSHLSSLKHAHKFAWYELAWSSDYHFQLLLRGVKHFLRQAVSRKSAITSSIVNAAWDSFDFSIPLHAAMCALFLAVFFIFLHKSNLVPDNTRKISPKVITRAHLVFTSSGADIHVSATTTIQCQQCSLVLPIPSLPESRLCPTSALRHHLSLNPGPSSVPLFTVLTRSGLQPITYSRFCTFLSQVVSRLHLDPSLFSPHSFRRGGATFAFDCHIPSEIIKLQGDWQSDAYLVYLQLSQQQKQHACHAMAAKLLAVFPE